MWAAAPADIPDMGLRGLRRLCTLPLLLCAAGVLVRAQEPSQKERIYIQIWAELDPIPGLFEEDSAESDPAPAAEPAGRSSPEGQQPPAAAPAASGTVRTVEQSRAERTTNAFTATARSSDITPFAFAINRTKEIAPFLLGGMIDGWSFDYTPSDRARQVSEYFEYSEIRPFDPAVNHLSFKNPEAREDRLVCWVSCDRTPVQRMAYERWLSIQHPRITGHGTAPVEDGFEGIKKACGEALKNAVREHWRTYVRNKPKEITGTVLLIEDPRIYIKDGQYVVDLDFFLETDRIVPYSYY